MWLLYFMVIGVSLGILLLILKLGAVNFRFLKENYKPFLAYILIQLTVFALLLSTVKLGNNMGERFVNGYILFMLSCGLSIILVSPIIGLLQKYEEKKIIEKYENQYKIDKFNIYRDLIGDISPAILFKLYNENKDIEDLVVASYIYLLHRGVIEVKKDKIVETAIKTNYSNEKLLVRYFTGEITKERMENNFFNDLKQDMKSNGFIYDSNKKIELSESMQLIIIWIIITLIIMMPAIIPIGIKGMFLVLAYIMAFIAIPIYEKIIKSIYPFFRTEKSLQIIAKLNGLKQFYKEFNIINHKSIEEIKLYDDYIIYGIIFNDKGTLNNEVHTLYKKICMYANESLYEQLKELPK